MIMVFRDTRGQTAPQQCARPPAYCRQQVRFSSGNIIMNCDEKMNRLYYVRLGFWDTVTGEEIRNIEVTKKGRVTCMDLSSDGK